MGHWKLTWSVISYSVLLSYTPLLTFPPCSFGSFFIHSDIFFNLPILKNPPRNTATKRQSFCQIEDFNVILFAIASCMNLRNSHLYSLIPQDDFLHIPLINRSWIWQSIWGIYTPSFTLVISNLEVVGNVGNGCMNVRVIGVIHFFSFHNWFKISKSNLLDWIWLNVEREEWQLIPLMCLHL